MNMFNDACFISSSNLCHTLHCRTISPLKEYDDDYDLTGCYKCVNI